MSTAHSVQSLASVLGCVSTKVRQRRPTEVLNVYKSCVCVVCVLFDRSEVSLECAPAGAEGSVCFLGSLLFWSQTNIKNFYSRWVVDFFQNHVLY